MRGRFLPTPAKLVQCRDGSGTLMTISGRVGLDAPFFEEKTYVGGCPACCCLACIPRMAGWLVLTHRASHITCKPRLRLHDGNNEGY